MAAFLPGASRNGYGLGALFPGCFAPGREEVTQKGGGLVGQDPGDDLVSNLVATDVEGTHLTDPELVAMFAVMLTSGNANDMISNAVIALDQWPDQRAMLREQPELLRNAIEEFLRYCPSVHGIHRVAVDDCEIAGFPVRHLAFEHLGRQVVLPVVTTPTLIRSIRPGTDTRALAHLKRILRAYRPDVVHTHSAKAGILGRLAASSVRVPAIVHTVHGAPFGPYDPWPRRTLWPCSTGTARTIPGKRAFTLAWRFASRPTVPISCRTSRITAGPAVSVAIPASVATEAGMVVRPS